MTAEHLKPLLDNFRDTELFCQVREYLAQGNIPRDVLEIVRLGRMTALQKANGGVRGTVASDMVRRWVTTTADVVGEFAASGPWHEVRFVFDSLFLFCVVMIDVLNSVFQNKHTADLHNRRGRGRGVRWSEGGPDTHTQQTQTISHGIGC